MSHRGVVDVQRDPLCVEPLAEQFELHFDNGVQILLRQRAEPDDVVDPIDELRLEKVKRIAGKIRRHDQHDVREIDGAPLSVGQPTVVK